MKNDSLPSFQGAPDGWDYPEGVRPLQTFFTPRNAAGWLHTKHTRQGKSENHQDPPIAPILYQGELLWLKATKDFGHVQIMKSDQQVVYSFALYTEPICSVSRFRAWNGHWSLAARDFLIQDGEILNEKLGFQEIFSWNLVDDKPVYLFRKGPRIGFCYDGKILPLEYQEVGHHFCCEFSSNNPYVGEDATHFFGKRAGVWYYVVVKFK